MPEKKREQIEVMGKRVWAVSTIAAALSVVVFTGGPCALPEWKFETKTAAASAHAETNARVGAIENGLSRIEGKLDALINMTKEILEGDVER